MLRFTAFTSLTCITAMAVSGWAEEGRESVDPIRYASYYAQPESVVSPSDLDPDEPVEPIAQKYYEDDACGKGCDDDCCDCSCYLFGPDEAWRLCDDECSRNRIGGWFSIGYHSNETPLSVTRGDLRAFNDVPGDLNLHQAWLYAEREAEACDCSWDWGYRVDIMYGTDAQKTQAFGNSLDAFGNPEGWDNDWDNGVYGWALPQAYLQVARGDLSIIAGHFFTLVGYEVVTAPDNFFYSHSLTMFNSEPFTHTGVLATYSVNDNVEVYAGWTLGWDTGFDQFQDGSNWLGGFKYSFGEGSSFTYISTAGDLGARGSNGYSHSLVFDFSLTERLNYVVQSDWVAIEPDARNGGDNNDQIGVNQYLFYTINDCLKAGARVEWWKTDGDSFNEVTLGVNYKPHANITLRPEWRHSFGNTPLAGPTGPVTNDISVFGIDMVITY